MSEAAFTIIDEGRVSQVTAAVRGGSVLLSPQAIHAALRWELKPQGLCKDDHCIPVADQRDLVTDDGIELAALAERLSRPLAIDLEEHVACMGASAAARSAQLAS